MATKPKQPRRKPSGLSDKALRTLVFKFHDSANYQSPDKYIEAMQEIVDWIKSGPPPGKRILRAVDGGKSQAS